MIFFVRIFFFVFNLEDEGQGREGKGREHLTINFWQKLNLAFRESGESKIFFFGRPRLNAFASCCFLPENPAVRKLITDDFSASRRMQLCLRFDS